MSIRHALLALLSEGPKYGLQLRQEFEARTGEVWPLNVGQVYTTLQRLERDGLVESDDAIEDSPQKGFHITGEGASELGQWLRTPPDLSSPPRDELVMKVLVAIRVPGVDVHEVVQVHRRYLVELMQQWTRLKENEAELDLSFALVVDAELFRLDAVLRWLDAADGRLKRASVEPTEGRFLRHCLECAAGKLGCRNEHAFKKCDGVSKIYGEGPDRRSQAMRDIDLTVDAGRALVAVMGPSGSGKSTLLTIAGSLESPTGGDVQVDGMNLSKMSHPPIRPGCAGAPSATCSRTSTCCPGSPPSKMCRSPSNSTALPGPQGPKRSRHGRPRRARVWLIGPPHFPDQLSGGERQRVAIAPRRGG